MTARVDPVGELPNLTDPAFGNPMLVHMTMLLAALDRPALPDTTVSDVRIRILRGVLNLERTRWINSLRIDELPSFAADTDRRPTRAAAVRAVVVATLTAPRSERACDRLLRTVPELADADGLTVGRLCRWLRSLYPADEAGVAPLRPDLLAEQLLADTDDLPSLADAALAAVLADAAGVEAGSVDDQQTITQILSELTRASHREQVHAAVDHLLSRRLPALVGRTIAVRHDRPLPPLPAAVAAALVAAPQPECAADVVDTLPRSSHALADLASVLAGQAVGFYRWLAAAAPDAYLPNLAGSLNNLANRLAKVGRHADALAPATEAVGLYHQLATELPERFRPYLQMAEDTLERVR
ncbi:MAG TPA: hypothetical protein VKP11_06110 [Frankiaceae bacterium]|nr:hypothetical protein [Frankiaceae bacterium]